MCICVCSGVEYRVISRRRYSIARILYAKFVLLYVAAGWMCMEWCVRYKSTNEFIGAAGFVMCDDEALACINFPKCDLSSSSSSSTMAV